MRRWQLYLLLLGFTTYIVSGVNGDDDSDDDGVVVEEEKIVNKM